MGLELLCFKEACRILKRSPKYWYIVYRLYALSLFNPRAGTAGRFAYYFCRYIDDVLDGDRKIKADSVEHVNKILAAMQSGKGGPPIIKLYRSAIKTIKKMSNDSDNPEEMFIKLIKNAILFDYMRTKKRKILSRKEINYYYNNNLAIPMDIWLILSGSKVRTKNIPYIVNTQGLIYTIRDMKKDLSRGIINIPKEELEMSNIDYKNHFSYKDVKSDLYLLSWIKNEVNNSRKKLRLIRPALTDKGSKKICMPFVRVLQALCIYQKLGLLGSIFYFSYRIPYAIARLGISYFYKWN